MCTPVHELNQPIHYHPIYKTPPVTKFTSQWGDEDATGCGIRDSRKFGKSSEGDSSARAQIKYDLSLEEAEIYQKFVELMAGLERGEVEDVGEDIIKDARERKMMRDFGVAAVDTTKTKRHNNNSHQWVTRAPKFPDKYAYGAQCPQLGAGQLG